MMRVVADVLQLLGLMLLVVAGFVLWVPLGWLMAGVAVLLVGLSLDPRVRRVKGDR